MREPSELFMVFALFAFFAAIVLPVAQWLGLGFWSGIGCTIAVFALFIFGVRYGDTLMDWRRGASDDEKSAPQPADRSSEAAVAQPDTSSEAVVDTKRQPSLVSRPSMSWERVGDHPRGALIAVSFGGVYPPGSEGNAFADAMIESLRSALTETQAVGVILDLSALDYRCGDAIAGLATPLLDKDKRFRPAAIVAVGHTGRALEPLLAPDFLLGIAGMKLVHTRPEALLHIERSLDRRAG